MHQHRTSGLGEARRPGLLTRMRNNHPAAAGLILFLAASAIYSAFLTGIFLFRLADAGVTPIWFGLTRLGHDYLVIALICYVATASVIVQAAIRRNVSDVWPSLDANAGRCEEVTRDIIAVEGWRRTLVGSGAVALVMATSGQSLVASELQAHGAPLLAAAFTGLIVGVVWISATAVHDLFSATVRLASVFRRHLVVDLLDISPRPPITHTGLASTLALALGVTLAMPLLNELEWALAAALYLGTVVVLGFVILLLPLLGARDAIAQAKAQALQDINAKLGCHKAVTSWSGPHLPEFTSLLFLRDAVSSTKTMPFATPALARWLIVILIPVGSWFAGAFVERFVDSALN